MVGTSLFSACIKVTALFGVGLVLILSLPLGAVGQGSTPQRGYQPSASYALSDIETINTVNGNLMLSLPLGKLPPGRGGLTGQLNLHYDSKLYDSKTHYYEDFEHLELGAPHQVIRNMLVDSDEGGWHYGTGYSLQLIDRVNQYDLPPQFPSPEAIYHWKVKVAFPDGSVREFMPRTIGSSHGQEGYYDIRPDGWQTRWVNGAYTQDFPFLTGPLNYYSFDGTYIRLEIQHDSDGAWGNNPWTLYFPDGTKVTNYGTRITDRNGNYVEFSNITYNGHPATQLMDQVGRKIIIEGGGISDGDVIHVPGVGGVDLTYQVHWKAIQVYKTYSTVFNDRYGDYPEMLGLQFVVSRIDLPAQSGGLTYLFGYNAADYTGTCCTPSYGWGELNSVTTPSGAQAQYQYQLDGQNGPGLDYLWDVVLKKRVTRKILTYQQQYDGNSTPVTETWNYNGTSIVNPDGGTVTQFSDSQRNYRTVQPDGTVIEKLWQANTPQGFPVINVYDEWGINFYDPQRVNSFVKTEFTSIRDANGNLARTAIKDYNYDKNGNVTSVSEYDWVDYGSVPRGGVGVLPTGIPANAVLKRVSTNNYAVWTPDASDSSSDSANSYWNISPNLKNAIAASEVSNGSATLSRAEFFYDDPASTGNLIQQRSWDSSKGGYSNPLSGANSVSVFRQYDGYGNPILTTDGRGYQTQFLYGSVGGFTDLYPTQIKTAYQTDLQRIETREYDFYTGLVTRATDVDNNVSTATVYDVFGRPTLVKAAEGKPEETRTTTEYSDADRRVIVRADLNTLGDGKLVSIQHYDQLGRIRLARQLEDAATQSATDETTGIKVQTRYRISNPCQPNNTSECLSANASSLASYHLVSNPYRAATADSGWTRTKSNTGGRMVETQTFAGSGLPAPWGNSGASTGTVATAYDANFTTVTDQIGKVRRSMIDGLGRLTRVDEPDGSGNLGSTSSPVQPTSYSYDALGNLRKVEQGQQQRFFMYDSFSRLIRAKNPEQAAGSVASNITDSVTGNSQWSMAYGYDNNGNLTARVDARDVTTTYTYDALNRNTNVVYTNDPNATPAINRYYDGWRDGVSQNIPNSKGRLWQTETTGASAARTTINGFDALGRPTSESQQFYNSGWSQAYTTQRGYNLAGGVSWQTYPSGRSVAYSYDSAGRTNSFTGNLGDGVQKTYASEITYSPFGSMTNEKFGTDTSLYNKLFYNSRAQLAEIRVGTYNPADGWWWNRGAIINFYSDGCWGSCGGSNSSTSMTDNNGNLQKQAVYIPNDDQISGYTMWWQQYGYDSLNRLDWVREISNEAEIWKQTFDYDRYGNRTINQSSNTWGTGINKKEFTVNTANNRLSVPAGQSGTMSYDNAGNLTVDTYSAAAVLRAYDAENRMTKETQANSVVAGDYTYNADGQRVRRKVNNVEIWQVYGMDNELLAEYAASGAPTSPQKEYGYRNGQLLVTAEAPTGSGASTQHVMWTNVVGVSVSGNSLTKTAATAWGNAGAASTQSIASGDGYVEFTASTTSTYRMCGLSHGDSDQNYTDIDFAMFPTDGASDSHLHIYESGIYRGDFGPYAVGDLLRVAVEGGVVKYRKNGTLLYTSAVMPSYPLLVDTALYSPGSTISNVVISGNQSGGSGDSVSIHWLVTDQLGTPRIIIDQTGALANVSRHDYLPFGEELYAGTGNRPPTLGYGGDNVRQKFTSKERDAETSLDYFGARYYASSQGRFTSVDQGPPELLEPQTWNRYQYARNNPLYYIDADGNKDTPAKDQRINQALAGDPTLLEVIKASVNFSQRAFEDALNRGELRGALNSPGGNKLRGLAGEAVVIDDLRRPTDSTGLPMSLLTTSQPGNLSVFGMSLPQNISPDIGAVYTNGDLGKVKVTGVLRDVVSNSQGATSSMALQPNVKFGLYEVKAGFTGKNFDKGAAQVAATAGLLKASGLPGIAVLAVDKAVFNTLSPQKRAALYNKVTQAGGYIQLYENLAADAAKRSRALITEAR